VFAPSSTRCGVVTGPWQMGKVDQGFVVWWVARHWFGGALTYLGYGGTGKQVRDILHVDDLFDLIDRQLQDFDTYNGKVYNVGGGSSISVSLQELTALCHEMTGKTVAIASVPEQRAADIRIYVSDCTKVRQVTGWQPKRQVNEILEDIVRWMRDNELVLKPVLS
jgi:CDP-paratose 2-epimerase